ncbi:hypothetical protein ACFFX0_24235 [Citricoccus parietis]|uniref:Uncharacterized protein n=1 Tax=Citricoccus parietis TaxID=592307 RepID=A0ABV5G5H2_9MICC
MASGLAKTPMRQERRSRSTTPAVPTLWAEASTWVARSKEVGNSPRVTGDPRAMVDPAGGGFETGGPEPGERPEPGEWTASGSPTRTPMAPVPWGTTIARAPTPSAQSWTAGTSAPSAHRARTGWLRGTPKTEAPANNSVRPRLPANAEPSQCARRVESATACAMVRSR